MQCHDCKWELPDTWYLKTEAGEPVCAPCERKSRVKRRKVMTPPPERGDYASTER